MVPLKEAVKTFELVVHNFGKIFNFRKYKTVILRLFTQNEKLIIIYLFIACKTYPQ